MKDALQPYDDSMAWSEHDLEILSHLSAESEVQVAFQGLRRSLDIHQESLSRALRRLQENGLVYSTEEGYRISPEGLARARVLAQRDQSPSVPVLRTVLPGEKEGRYAADGLRQRWFGPLRWYGFSQDLKGVTLSWTTEDGGIRLDARFEGILLSVDARLANQSRISEAIVAAHRLLYEITRTYIVAGQRALPPPNS